jgi:hypothetical protein
MNSQLSTRTLARVFLALMVTAVAASLPTTAAVVPAQFGAATNFPAGSNPRSLVVADFNGDGKPDIATRSSYFGVSLLLGLGNGTFAAPTNAAPTNYIAYASVMATGDFNNDRKLDLVTANDYGTIIMLLGDGTGKFVATNFGSSYSSYPVGAAVGDFNGDGKLDLAVANYSGFVDVAFGKGDGTLGTPTNYYLTTFLGDIRVGDCNGDGRLDLVVSPKDSDSFVSFCVLTNKGNGIFAAPQYYTNDFQLYSRYSLELGDFNSDGRLDVAVLNYNAQSVTIRLNTGNGIFGPTNNYSVGFSPTSIAAGEFNGDGKIDLIVRGGSAARVLLGNGDGSFTVGAQMAVPDDTGVPGTVGVEDFNGDGLPDLAFTCYSSNSVAVMLNQTPPALQITPMAGYNQINWLATFGAGYTLECTTNLSAPDSWQSFPYPPVVIGNQKAVTDWADGQQKFYRLRK